MNKKGFTLIELLVVIAIIGVLSTIAILNYNETRKKARNSRRIQEFSSFSNGLELYYDLYGMYPCGDAVENTNLNLNLGGTFDTSGSGCQSDSIDAHGFLNGFGTVECDGVTAVVPPSECAVNYNGLKGAGILSTNRPNDPLGESTGDWWWTYAYHVTPDRQKYILGTYLERGENTMKNDGGLCDYFYEIGTAVGELKPWYEMACHCDGSAPRCN